MPRHTETRIENPTPGVHLPHGTSASALLYRLLREATERHPAALRDAELPADPARFRTMYAESLVRYEAARVATPARTQVAAEIADAAYVALRYVSPDGRSTPLPAWMSGPGEPLALTRVAFPGKPGLRPRVPRHGAVHEGGALRELGDELVSRWLLTRPAADALAALVSRAERAGGALDLSGRRFAVLGAAAELSPARLLLEAGAEVLWLDVRPPTADLLESRDLAGAVSWCETGADLLTTPRELVATITRFAQGEPLDLVLAAYAPGGGREWRLAAAMNAVVRALDPALVRGVGCYVSPTTPAVLQPAEAAEAARRASDPAGWMRVLATVDLLPPGPHTLGDVHITRALVPMQGVSYQAAQYIEKLLAAERFALLGTRDGAPPPRVSANVAPITATRSLEHPLFAAGFLGATDFGLEVFAPETTRALNGLLLLGDLLGAGEVPADPAAALFSRQVHGGAYALPYALDESIRVAAVLGLSRRPRLLLDLARRALTPRGK